MIRDNSPCRHYTVQNDPLVDRLVGQQVKRIASGVVREVKNIVALFLTGGYARGEGSVLVEGDNIIPLGDYDILVISSFPHFHHDFSWLRPLEREFKVQYHVEVSILWKPLLSFFRNRIYSYEVKFGSRLIFGDSRVLNMIPIGGGHAIDVGEGYSLMFNRLMGLLKVFDLQFMRESHIEKEQRLHLLFQSIKTVLSCGESLLLLNHRYHFSYEERLLRLQQCFRSDFDNLLKLDSSLETDYVKASHFKLKPRLGMYPEPVDLWFDAKRHVIQTLIYYMMRTGRSTNGSLSARSDKFIDLFLNSSKPDFIGFTKFNWNAISKHDSLKGLNRIKPSCSDIVRASIFCVALSLQQDGYINEEFLDKALTLVKGILPVSSKVDSNTDLKKKWRSVRDSVFQAWTLVRQ